MQSPTRDRDEAETKERRHRKNRTEGPNASGYTSPPTDTKANRSLSPLGSKDRSSEQNGMTLRDSCIFA